MKMQLALLRAASLLVPSTNRAEWLAEWDAELRHVRLVSRHSWAFCRGAFADAFWFRLWSAHFSWDIASPAHCLLWLGLLSALAWIIAASLPGARNLVLPSPWADARQLALVSPDGGPASGLWTQVRQVTFGEFGRWKTHRQTPFEKLAFYQLVGPHTVRTSRDLLELLRPKSNAGAFPRQVPGVMGKVNAWVVEDEPEFERTPLNTKGYVLARVKPQSFGMASGGRWYIPAPGDNWGFYGFNCTAVAPSFNGSLRFFLMMLGIGLLIAALTTSLSLGGHAGPGSRRWIFLAAKTALILPGLYCGALDLIALAETLHSMAPVMAIYPAYPLAIAWIAADQRRRCPVCLHRLTNPARVGQGVGTLLGYSATELVCQRGHGLMHIPEFPTICFHAQKWFSLDASWRGLFPNVPGR
jgi:hypothetical protein